MSFSFWRTASSERQHLKYSASRDFARASLASWRCAIDECLVYLEKVETVGVPKGRLYVKAWVEDAHGAVAGSQVSWSAKTGTRCPSWYCALPLGMSSDEHPDAQLRMELRDQKRNTILASLVLKLNELPVRRRIVKDMFVHDVNTSAPTRQCRLSFQILNGHAVKKRRTVFFVRHAESCWNRAQKTWNAYELARRKDHPLSREGRCQAEQLAQSIKHVIAQASDLEQPKPGVPEEGVPEEDCLEATSTPKQKTEDRHGWRNAPPPLQLAHADAIYVSPLTRALQTALIAFQPALMDASGPQELVLMASAREKQNFGGFDTKAEKIGSDIVKHALEELRVLYAPNGGCADLIKVADKVRVDDLEVQDRWWHQSTSESLAELHARMHEFMCQLLYSPHRIIVVVGHSHFFRNLMSTYVAESLRAQRPTFVKNLCTMKLSNCGVVRLELDPNCADGRWIVKADLILDTQLHSSRRLWRCCCRRSRKQAVATE